MVSLVLVVFSVKLQSMFMLLLNVFLVVWPFDLEFQNALKRKTWEKSDKFKETHKK